MQERSLELSPIPTETPASEGTVALTRGARREQGAVIDGASDVVHR
jgi:hypothetical protein